MNIETAETVYEENASHATLRELERAPISILIMYYFGGGCLFGFRGCLEHTISVEMEKCHTHC